MNRKKPLLFNNLGVSEVIGTILLLSLSVTLFSVVYVTVLSFPGAPSTPASNIAVSVNETSVVLTHSGGTPLRLNSKVQIVYDDIVYSCNISKGLTDDEKDDNYWGFGEQCRINFTDIGLTEEIGDNPLTITVIDVDSNSVVMTGTKSSMNRPPIVSSPLPYNTATGVYIGISQLHITISDPDDDLFNWTIQGQYVISSSATYDHNGVKSANLIIPVPPSIAIQWYVNATDAHGLSTNKTFTFTCAKPGEHHKRTVESNTSNVDLSTPADKGMEMNFINAQANTTNGTVMNIEEADYGHQDYTTAVQGNTTNVDGSADLGTETNFINCKETARDGDNMSLVESVAGLPAVSEYDYVDSFTSTSAGWTTSGTTPYIAAVGGGYITTSTNGAVERWFTFGDTASTGDSLVVELQVYVTAGDGDDDITVGIDTTGDNIADYTGTFTNPTSGWYSTGVVSGLNTHATVNSARASFTHTKSSNANTITIDCARLYVTRASTINYRLDVEYNWSAAYFSEQTEQLCFYVQRHTGGTENLMVKYWTGSTWSWLGNITTSGWTNLTAVGLTAGTYSIRLNGSKATNDITQDTWEIDCMFLHTYNGTNYKIDFEYQWTNAIYSDTNEMLCLYITSISGESLNINYRNGVGWTNLGTITGTGWVNVTATGLSSSTYTIQLIGSIESNDITKDSWTIDCIYLHTWT